MVIICTNCGKEAFKSTSHYNRAIKISPNMFCGQSCFGIYRRTSLEEKKKVKAEYDKKLRSTPEYKIYRAKQFKQHYDPEKAAIKRKERMPYHVEYCRQPKYKEKKKVYDKKRVAQQNYGEFWESALLIREIESEYNQQEVREINNLHNKTQKRKRKWKNQQSQNCRLST